jgi:hypothetical protein
VISLKSLIGQRITAWVPAWNQKTWLHFKLVNVEEAGIWVESKDAQEFAMEDSGVTASPKTAVFFLPFSSIVHVLASMDEPYLSDRML